VWQPVNTVKQIMIKTAKINFFIISQLLYAH
jgi:hypothetical protein